MQNQFAADHKLQQQSASQFTKIGHFASQCFPLSSNGPLCNCLQLFIGNFILCSLFCALQWSRCRGIVVIDIHWRASCLKSNKLSVILHAENNVLCAHHDVVQSFMFCGCFCVLWLQEGTSCDSTRDNWSWWKQLLDNTPESKENWREMTRTLLLPIAFCECWDSVFGAAMPSMQSWMKPCRWCFVAKREQWWIPNDHTMTWHTATEAQLNLGIWCCLKTETVGSKWAALKWFQNCWRGLNKFLANIFLMRHVHLKRTQTHLWTCKNFLVSEETHVPMTKTTFCLWDQSHTVVGGWLFPKQLLGQRSVIWVCAKNFCHKWWLTSVPTIKEQRQFLGGNLACDSFGPRACHWGPTGWRGMLSSFFLFPFKSREATSRAWRWSSVVVLHFDGKKFYNRVHSWPAGTSRCQVISLNGRINAFWIGRPPLPSFMHLLSCYIASRR